MSLDINKIKEQIEHGNTSLGIELGSTRIKAVLIGEDHTPIASGSHDWENRYVDHIWTYTLAFDKEGELLVPFRTWRNTITGPAAGKLTEVFRYNIPQRWSIAHLYQAILNKEEHVKDIDYLITLEGYVHWKLTGRRVLGIGDVAGMFPVDIHARGFDQNPAQGSGGGRGRRCPDGRRGKAS